MEERRDGWAREGKKRGDGTYFKGEGVGGKLLPGAEGGGCPCPDSSHDCRPTRPE